MESKTAPARKPVDIARVALRKMAELGLPPTPEHFTDQYRRAGGLPAVDPGASAEGLRGLEMESMLRGIVDMITQTASGLSGGLDRFGGEVKGMLSKVDQADSGEGLRALMQALTISALALQEAVDESRTELAQTQEKLAKVSTELEHTHEQARTDPLTGFINRRGMDEVIVREIARSRRAASPLCVAMLDIDHFKKVNDQHGHDVGDLALVHLARVARSGVRETDIVCRYGGEEFVIVLPGAAAEGAHFVIDRMRSMMEKTPLVNGTDRIEIRFSAGLAELGAEETREGLLKRADLALYEAKRAGRNRVVVAAAVTASAG